MKKLLSTLLILTSFNSIGQTFKVELEPFDALEVSRGIEAILVYSDTKELSFEVKGVDKSDIVIDQSRSKLSIKVKSKALWETMQENSWYVKVIIPYQHISEIDASTGATVESDTLIKSETLYLDSHMGAVIDLEVNANKLIVDATMGAICKLRGRSKTVNVDANMGSIVRAFELNSKYSNVESSMGAIVSVTCEYEFDGSASMGGEIKVKGNPEKSYERENMGGYIKSL